MYVQFLFVLIFQSVCAEEDLFFDWSDEFDK